AQRRLQGLEQGRARTRYPATVGRDLAAGQDLPVGREPAKMIDADDVGERELATDPGDPPGVAVPGHRLPVVERVAPALAGLREEVRRHPGDHRLLEVLVE